MITVIVIVVAVIIAYGLLFRGPSTGRALDDSSASLFNKKRRVIINRQKKDRGKTSATDVSEKDVTRLTTSLDNEDDEASADTGNSKPNKPPQQNSLDNNTSEEKTYITGQEPDKPTDLLQILKADVDSYEKYVMGEIEKARDELKKILDDKQREPFETELDELENASREYIDRNISIISKFQEKYNENEETLQSKDKDPILEEIRINDDLVRESKVATERLENIIKRAENEKNARVKEEVLGQARKDNDAKIRAQRRKMEEARRSKAIADLSAKLDIFANPEYINPANLRLNENTVKYLKENEGVNDGNITDMNNTLAEIKKRHDFDKFTVHKTLLFKVVETEKDDANFKANYRPPKQKKPLIKILNKDQYDQLLKNYRKEVNDKMEELKSGRDAAMEEGWKFPNSAELETGFTIYLNNLKLLNEYMKLMDEMANKAVEKAKAEEELSKKLEIFKNAKKSSGTGFTPDDLILSPKTVNSLKESLDESQSELLFDFINADLNKIKDLHANHSDVLIRMYKTVESKPNEYYDSQKFRVNYGVNGRLLQDILKKKEYESFLRNYYENAKDRRERLELNDDPTDLPLKAYEKEIKKLRMYMELMKAAAAKLDEEIRSPEQSWDLEGVTTRHLIPWWTSIKVLDDASADDDVTAAENTASEDDADEGLPVLANEAEEVKKAKKIEEINKKIPNVIKEFISYYPANEGSPDKDDGIPSRILILEGRQKFKDRIEEISNESEEVKLNETHNIMQVIKLGEDILNHLGAIVYDASVSEQKDSFDFGNGTPGMLKDVRIEKLKDYRTELYKQDSYVNVIENITVLEGNLDDTEKVREYLAETMNYILTYMDQVIEPEMSVRSIIKLYKPPEAVEFHGKINKTTIELTTKGGKLTKYGSFKQVINKNEFSDYDPSYDVNEIYNGRQMIYAGYGYSGSGKTHTLLNENDGLLKKLLDRYEQGIDSKDHFKNYRFEFVEIYGEIDDNTCPEGKLMKNPPTQKPSIYIKKLASADPAPTAAPLAKSAEPPAKSAEPAKSAKTVEPTKPTQNSTRNRMTVRRVVQGGSAGAEIDRVDFKPDLGIREKQRLAFENMDQLVAFINKLSEFRQDPNNYNPKVPRVRVTPNNPESSRAHLIINVYDDTMVKDSKDSSVKRGDARVSTAQRFGQNIGITGIKRRSYKLMFSILDMGGSEEVDDIRDMYYNKITDMYKSKEFAKIFKDVMTNLSEIQTSQLPKNELKIKDVFDVDQKFMTGGAADSESDGEVGVSGEEFEEGADEIVANRPRGNIVTELFNPQGLNQEALLKADQDAAEKAKQEAAEKRRQAFRMKLQKYIDDPLRQKQPRQKKFVETLKTLVGISSINLQEFKAEGYVMKKDQWLKVFSGPNQQEEFAEFFIDEKVQKHLNVYEVLDQILNLPIRDNSNSGEKPLKTFYNAYFINRIIEKVNASEDFFNLKLPLIEIKLKKTYTEKQFEDEERKSVDQLQKNDYAAHTDYLDFLRKKYSLEGQDANLAVMKKFQLGTDKFDNFSTFLEHLKNNYGGKSYPDKYDAFANAIIKKYHCPLRFQGNYINKSIEEFGDLTENIKGKRYNKSPGPITKQLYDALQIDNDNIQDKKVVIFTCISTGTRDKDSIKRSLEFAHCINPFKNTSGDYDDCTKKNKQNTMAGGQGVLPKVNNIDMTLSEESMSIVQNLGFYNLIKLMRWKFYTERSRTDSLEVTAFKDYIATLILCVFLFATKQDKLALGTLADQIISMSVYSKFDDDKVLLLPYYIPFL